METRKTITQFDAFLAQRGLSFEAIVIGGAALNLLGVVTRPTRDCDVVFPEIPAEILEAVQIFALKQRQAGEDLQDDWLNGGPGSLIDVLPEGWQNRLKLLFSGKALTLHTLGRTELLMSKLFALCDRGIDLQDCIALAPDEHELDSIVIWLEQQDANPDWPAHVRETIANLNMQLHHHGL